MPRLIVEKGADKGKVVRVSRKAALLVGRDSKATFRLSDALTSRLHFKIEARDDGFWVADLKSMNGTFVNGARVEEVKLAFNDKLQIGETLFSFLADEEKGDKENLIGKSLQGYRIDERLGRGGMGTVYRALQTSLNRVVALKILSPELIKDPNFIAMFEQEAHAAAQLNHPNIVQVYDFGKSDNLYFFSMEFLGGGSVQDLLSREKRLTPKRAVRVALEAARGLEYAEKKKIVHRDIKPDNLMIGEEEAIKIGDLGLAKSLKEGPAAPEDGTILGTPHYVAPEQALGRPVDPRVDIYALGATLYRMVAGTTPYSGNTVKEILIRKVKEEPPGLKTIDPELPDRLISVIEKMMAKDPDARHQSAAEVIPDLDLLRDELEGRTTSYPVQLDSAATLMTTDVARRRPPAGLLAAGALVLAAFSIGGYFGVKSWLGGPTTANVPVANNGPSREYNELANLLLEQAHAFEKKEGVPAKPARYDDVIREYQTVLDRCPASASAQAAKVEIARLRTSQLDLVRRLAAHEEDLKAQAWTDEALAALRTAEEDYWKTLDLGPVNAPIARLAELEGKEFKDQGVKGTGSESAARDGRIEGERWVKDVAPLVREARDAQQKLPGLVEEHRFKDAFPLLIKLQERLSAARVTGGSLAGELNKLRTAEKDYLDTVIGRVETQAESRQFDAAYAELAQLEGCLFDLKSLEMAKRERSSVDERKRDFERQASLAKQRQEESQLEAAVVQAIVSTARPRYAYDEAYAALQEAVGRLTVPAVKEQGDAVLEQFRVERAAWTAFANRGVRDPGTNKSALMGRTHVILGRRVQIMEVLAKNLVVTEDGKTEYGMQFDRITVPELAQVLFDAWTPTPEENAGIGLFALRRLCTELGVKALTRVPPGDPKVGALALTWQKNPRRLYDQEAALLFKAGQSSAGAHPEETTRLFKLLAEQYGASDTYQRRKDAIEKWVKEHP